MTRQLVIGVATLLYFLWDVAIWTWQPDWLKDYGTVAGIITHIWAIPGLLLCREKKYNETDCACYENRIIYSQSIRVKVQNLF